MNPHSLAFLYSEIAVAICSEVEQLPKGEERSCPGTTFCCFIPIVLDFAHSTHGINIPKVLDRWLGARCPVPGGDRCCILPRRDKEVRCHGIRLRDAC